MADQWQNAIGKGFGIAMDQIWNAAIGNGPQSAIRKGDTSKFSPEDLWAATNLIPGGGAGKVAVPVVKAGIKTAATNAAKALVKRALAKPQIAVRVPEHQVSSIIESGGLKNMFSSPSVNANDLASRVKFEHNTLGIPETASAAERPVYGFTTVPGLPAVPGESKFSKLTQLLSPANPKAKAYGDVTAILKKPSGTYTIGDSFTTRAPVEKIGKASDATVKSVLGELVPASEANPFTTSGAQYIENQIPLAAGNLSNFKKFLVDNPAQVKVISAQLKQAGYNIPVKTSLDGKIAAIQNIIKKSGAKPAVDFSKATKVTASVNPSDWYKPAPSPFD